MKVYPFTLDDLPGEEWKPIPDWQGYEVSNFGRVKSFKTKPRIMKPAFDKGGYLQAVLSEDDKAKFFRVNRLVALCFIPNPENKPHVNHIDGNKFNNHVSNLEWATPKENQRHAAKLGLIKSGADNYQAAFTNEQVLYHSRRKTPSFSYGDISRTIEKNILRVYNVENFFDKR
ncbi:MAG: HNH endonuclease [Quinella sp. 1Q5]|nr:HNH endonuclease [Quinella sp. 1Q5]